MARIEIGKHLAADSRICRGRLIFKGTRILVSDALELTKAGYTPEAIARQYRGIITARGVREALTLTRRGIVREIPARARPPRDNTGPQHSPRSGSTASAPTGSVSANRF